MGQTRLTLIQQCEYLGFYFAGVRCSILCLRPYCRAKGLYFQTCRTVKQLVVYLRCQQPCTLPPPLISAPFSGGGQPKHHGPLMRVVLNQEGEGASAHSSSLHSDAVVRADNKLLCKSNNKHEIILRVRYRLDQCYSATAKLHINSGNTPVPQF